jgi:hypothetical protein
VGVSIISFASSGFLELVPEKNVIRSNLLALLLSATVAFTFSACGIVQFQSGAAWA